MTTWISRVGAALLCCAGLAACEGVDGSGGFLDALATSGATKPARPPLTQAVMMRGGVTLVPPAGFCIDPYSLRQDFALMARCDTLGANTGGRGAPLGLMTASFTRSAAGAALPSASDYAKAAGLAAPERQRDAADHTVFATRGTPPTPELSDLHWRAVARLGTYTMGVALFGAEGKRALSIEGAGLVEDLIARTRSKT
ncbi:hypothetical protein ABMC89_12455 [Sulfitobacter sp. HNIBRBA3233]|uniref:hypothetical protein n=1 Tax=Sulfitobacter marinivivus TaxID=3158558 RepID=UPI0032DF08E0